MGVEGEEGEEEVLAVVSRLHLTDCQPLSVCVGVCNIVCVCVQCICVCVYHGCECFEVDNSNWRAQNVRHKQPRSHKKIQIPFDTVPCAIGERVRYGETYIHRSSNLV